MTLKSSADEVSVVPAARSVPMVAGDAPAMREWAKELVACAREEGVELTAYRDPVSGSIFAVDDSFIEQVSVFIPSIYNSGTLQLDEDNDANSDKTSRKLPVSTWPGGDDSAGHD